MSLTRKIQRESSAKKALLEKNKQEIESMAKKSVVERQKKREELVRRHWEKRMKLRTDVVNMALSEEEREQAKIALNKMPRDTSYIRLRSRCKLTGRPRGVLKKFSMCRHSFREFALSGNIPGVTKASW